MSWDDIYTNEFWIRWSNRPPLEITLDWIKSIPKLGGHKRVFDMGCGLGRHTLILAESGFSVTASDISPHARQITYHKIKSKNFNVAVINADIYPIPFPDEYFDAILSIGVLEHSTRIGIEQAIDEIFRTLSPKGKILASFYPRNRWISKDKYNPDIIEDNTLKFLGPEKTIHHLVDEKELKELFTKFTIHSIDLQKEQFEGVKSEELFISAQKPK